MALTSDPQLLAIKAHMFLSGAAAVTVSPFIKIIAKQNGLSATLAGFVSTVVPLTSLASRTFSAVIADKFQNIQLILIVGSLLHAIFQFMLVCIPPLPPTNISIQTTASCVKSSDIFHVKFSHGVDVTCLTAGNEPSNISKAYCTVTCIKNPCSDRDPNCRLETSFHVINRLTSDVSLAPSSSAKCNPDKQYECDITCKITDDRCSSKDQQERHWQETIKTSSFNLFFFFHFIAHLAGDLAVCLGDTATFAVLGAKASEYGRQRMWATIGWGLFAPIAGLLNDFATTDEMHQNYRPGFYLMIVLTVLHLVALKYLKIPPVQKSRSIIADVRAIFSNTETLYFSVCVFISGCFYYLIAGYQFWYLQEIGASQTLLGLTLFSNCLIGELPVFYFSGWMLRWTGYRHAVTLSLIAYILRLMGYVTVKDPMNILPFEVLHGLTFGIFWAAMTIYANSISLPGTQATVQSIFSNIFSGLGQMVGNLLAGALYDTYGGRLTFLYYCKAAVVLVLIHIAICYRFSRKQAYDRIVRIE